MKALAFALAGILFATAAGADPLVSEPPDPLALKELDALRLEHLHLGLRYLDERAKVLRYELAEVQRGRRAQQAEFDRALREAATKAGVDPATHRPDTVTKRWVPVER